MKDPDLPFSIQVFIFSTSHGNSLIPLIDTAIRVTNLYGETRGSRPPAHPNDDNCNNDTQAASVNQLYVHKIITFFLTTQLLFFCCTKDVVNNGCTFFARDGHVMRTTDV